jgi:hypothetical protein
VKPLLRLRVRPDGAQAELSRRQTVRWSGTVAYENAEEMGAAIRDLLTGGTLPERPGVLDVEIEKPLVQVRSLRGLPPVSTPKLRGIVSTQSGRFFRKNGKPLVIDAVWDGRSGPDRVALAVAVEEPWVEAIAEAAHASGVRLASLGPAGLPGGRRFRLLSPGQRKRYRRDQLLALKRLAAAATALWLFAAATAAGRMHAERARLDSEIVRLEAPVAAMGRAGRALDSASRMVRGIATAEADRGRILATLTAISAALPDSAYITALTLDRRGRGELTVVARHSSEVLAAFEQSTELVSPQLEGGVVRETSAGREWERFTVTLGGVAR